MLILFGPLLILGFIISHLAKLVAIYANHIMGRILYLSLFGWLGTTIHELGHALFCLLFGHKITNLRLFYPDSDSQTLGSVSHTYYSDSLYQRSGNFFIGIGPIILGSLVIFSAAHLLLGANMLASFDKITLERHSFNSWTSLANLVIILFLATVDGLIQIFYWQNLVTWQFYLFLYITFAVGSSVSLSLSDIEGILSGFRIIVIILFVFNLLTFWVTGFALQPFLIVSRYFAYFYAIMVFIIILNLMALGILLLFNLSKRY
jgi:hypothetical protein